MDIGVVLVNHRIRPVTVAAVLGRDVQQAESMSQCLTDSVNKHFEDPRIWQGTSVLDQRECGDLLIQSATRQKDITFWWTSIQVQVQVCVSE